MKSRWAFAWVALLVWVAASPGAALATPVRTRGSRIYDLKDGLLAGVPAAAAHLTAAGRGGLVAHAAAPGRAPVYGASLLRPLDIPLPLLCLFNTRDGFALYRRQTSGQRVYGTSQPRSQAAPTSLWCLTDPYPQVSPASGGQAIRPSAVPDALWRRINSRNGFDV